MASVFISHSHAEKLFARRIAADIAKSVHHVWIDEAEILIGDSLIEKIGEALEAVDYVLAILSSHSIGSKWVRQDLDIAIDREINGRKVVVLPALIEDVELPIFLRGKLYADFRVPANYENELAKVLRSLRRVAGGLPRYDEDSA
jgi:predicted nucleotide-binding protein